MAKDAPAIAADRPHVPGPATRRRHRQVRWGHRLRRLGLAWQNGLELARAGRLTAPYGFPFEVQHEDRVYKLRRYQATGAQTVAAPLLLVPPLMIASEVYDISPDVSAVAFLVGQGVDVWLTDFGAPEDTEGGLTRTLDDHIRAVSDAIDRVRAATGHDVHLAGYSQGGMFAYQAAAFRKGRNIASVITYGSPVDLHRTVPIADEVTERLVAGVRGVLSWPLSKIEGLPGAITSTGFKLLSARKEAMQLVDFVRNLHDRAALEKREAKRIFLRGDGFVAWPGPAFRKFVDDLVVANRMASGGFVVDGHTVTLADIRCPILYFVGDRDELGRPAAVRSIRRAAPEADCHEVLLQAGHFGLVVGSTALRTTWPTTIAWMRWREGTGPEPATTDEPSADTSLAAADAGADGELAGDDRVVALEHDDYDSAFGEMQFDLQLASDVAGKAARAVLERAADAATGLSGYLESLRFQVPRLNRLRRLDDDTPVSMGRSLAEQAETIPERTFFLWRGRAFTYAEANRRVDAVVRGLISAGVRPGQRVGVLMKSRPSHLSLVAATSRLGAVAVLLSPDTPDDVLPRALDLGEVETLVTDPETAARARASFGGKVFVLGGVGEPAVVTQPGAARTLPAGVVDLEAVDPEAVALPPWYRADPGRARDLAMVLVTAGRHEPPRASRITNRRWAFSALGAAAAATLTTRDTVYCALPLHHAAGMLVAVGSALVGGARLALASRFEPEIFWDEVRRYGATVVFYAGEMCRRLVDAPFVVGEKNNPVRLFAGSGMRQDVWRRLVDRFGPVAVLEFYASTEASAVLVNTAGKKVGAVGRALPGSPELAIAAWDFEADDFVRDLGGRLVRARIDEPGMLIARAGGDAHRGAADFAHIDPRRLLRDAFATGDTWFVTGDFLRMDAGGDYWFVDRHHDIIATPHGPVPSQRIEDALYAASSAGHGIAMCIAVGVPDGVHEQPMVALELADDAELDLDALAAAVRALPDHARPRRLRVVDELPITDGSARSSARWPRSGSRRAPACTRGTPTASASCRRAELPSAKCPRRARAREAASEPAGHAEREPAASGRHRRSEARRRRHLLGREHLVVDDQAGHEPGGHAEHAAEHADAAVAAAVAGAVVARRRRGGVSGAEREAEHQPGDRQADARADAGRGLAEVTVREVQHRRAEREGAEAEARRGAVAGARQRQAGEVDQQELARVGAGHRLRRRLGRLRDHDGR
ncbi:MAG: AMP-binding protein [Kofleriaceae bacterium]